MDFAFSDEQLVLRENLREFLQREYPPDRQRRLDSGAEHLSEEDFRKLADLGYMSLPYPRQYGGQEADPITVGMVVEEMSRYCPALANAYIRTYQCCRAILNYGSVEQIQEYIPRTINEGMTCAFALTEPEAGSDAAALTTTARKVDNSYIVKGQKVFITGADIAGVMLTAVRTNIVEPKQQGISVLLIDPKTENIRYHALNKLGVRGTHSFQIYFDDVRIPSSALLGEENHGWEYITRTLEIERTFLAISSVGAAQQAVDETIKYVTRRHQFGRPIGKFQAVRHKVAEMQTQVTAARWLSYYAAWLISRGLPARKEAAMAKLFASETWAQVTTDGMQLFGGYGYIMDSDINRYFRDARLNPVGGGTSEIQRSIIARELGL